MKKFSLLTLLIACCVIGCISRLLIRERIASASRCEKQTLTDSETKKQRTMLHTEFFDQNKFVIGTNVSDHGDLFLLADEIWYKKDVVIGYVFYLRLAGVIDLESRIDVEVSNGEIDRVRFWPPPEPDT